MANEYVNKVVYGGDTLIDLTGDTATAEDVLAGKTFHAKSGAPTTGTCSYDADTSDATAAAAEILATKTAYVGGSKVTGSMPNRGGADRHNFDEGAGVHHPGRLSRWLRQGVNPLGRAGETHRDEHPRGSHNPRSDRHDERDRGHEHRTCQVGDSVDHGADHPPGYRVRRNGAGQRRGDSIHRDRQRCGRQDRDHRGGVDMASEPNVNRDVNKVVFGDTTVMDITDTTATASDVAEGKVFYAATGARSVGTASSGGGITIDDVYPVGSIYMSVNSTDPGTLFGGTWVQLEDTFLLAAGTNHAAGSTGGEETHLLTAGESGVHGHGHGDTLAFTLPSHSHHLANSVIVYNSTGTQRLATSGSGTLASVNTNVGVNTSTPVTTPACTKSGSVTDHAGSDATDAHNNMPPYLAVYMWKRTA